MSARLQSLTELALALQRRLSLDDLLRLVVDRTSTLLSDARASVRLFDPSRERLVATCRSGVPDRVEPVEFKRGEGLVGRVAERGELLWTNSPQQHEAFVAKPGTQSFDAFIGAPLLAGQESMGVLSVLGHNRQFTQQDASIVSLVAAICAPYFEIGRLSRLSQIDPLTGALNRRGLEGSFPERTMEESTEPVSVIMADIDRFKLINDTYGHAAGDEVLKHVTRLLSDVVRTGDAVVRYGGEEFLLVLPSVGLQRARLIAERARATVAEHPTPHAGSRLVATISLGVAERKPGESRGALLTRADLALYEAKNQGRNCVAESQ
ncbi:MAG: sensor domain-containing diguanylate cyclase [Nannocystaceae bacterium]|nr:sensor domain-containing diguanylate cyclase [Nannocystaceae bacterium]